jgi:type IV secretory pathway TrbD component
MRSGRKLLLYAGLVLAPILIFGLMVWMAKTASSH